MDVQRLIDNSIRSQGMVISRNAGEAIQRIETKYAIPTGLCGCGKEVDTHTLLDEHTPIEQYIDKAWATAEDYYRMYMRELLRHYRENAFKNPRWRVRGRKNP